MTAHQIEFKGRDEQQQQDECGTRPGEEILDQSFLRLREYWGHCNDALDARETASRCERTGDTERANELRCLSQQRLEKAHEAVIRLHTEASSICTETDADIIIAQAELACLEGDIPGFLAAWRALDSDTGLRAVALHTRETIYPHLEQLVVTRMQFLVPSGIQGKHREDLCEQVESFFHEYARQNLIELLEESITVAPEQLKESMREVIIDGTSWANMRARQLRNPVTLSATLR